jgi:hypothetical protein
LRLIARPIAMSDVRSPRSNRRAASHPLRVAVTASSPCPIVAASDRATMHAVTSARSASRRSSPSPRAATTCNSVIKSRRGRSGRDQVRGLGAAEIIGSARKPTGSVGERAERVITGG